MRDAIPFLTPDDMATIEALVYEQSGIRLTAKKSALVNARLHKRVRAQGFSSFRAYLDHVRCDPRGAESLAMIDALTTNHTSFFREREHFRFLAEHVVPEALASGASSIAGWSAGCATGEEPYSIVMTLLDALRGRGGCAIEIVASDVSANALATAARGVYEIERVGNIPGASLRRYFERGVGAEEGLARVRAPVRRLVRFEQANLLEPRRLGTLRRFIYCRNTLMYFDESARQRAVTCLGGNLAPGGYLFVSHAENLAGLDHDLVRLAPAIYQRRMA